MEVPHSEVPPFTGRGNTTKNIPPAKKSMAIATVISLGLSWPRILSQLFEVASHLRKFQQTLGTYPRYPKTQIWKDSGFPSKTCGFQGPTIYRIYTACAYNFTYIYIYIYIRIFICKYLYTQRICKYIYLYPEWHKKYLWKETCGLLFSKPGIISIVVDSISSFWKHMKAPKFSMPRSFQTNFKPSRFRGMVYRLQIQHGTWKWWGIWFFFPPYKKKQIWKKKKLDIIHFHTWSLQPFR